MSDYGNEEGEEFECEWPEEDPNQVENDGGPEIELQNTFYTAEDLKRNQPAEALEMFETVIMLSESLEEEVKYRFLALQNIVVLSATMGRIDNMIAKQSLLLKMVNKVAREDLSDAVNAVLDAVASHLGEQPDAQGRMYKMTLDVLKSSNERLWFTICLRLGKIYMDLKNFELLDALITELKESCRGSGAYDQSKANLLLEVLALEIQMCSAAKNNARMKAVYLETQKLNSVINDPRVVAIIKETGGKIYMSEKRWATALDEMFESFKNY